MTSRAAILVFKNNKTAAMLVFQTNPVGIELFSYVNAFFCSNKFARYIMGDVQVASVLHDNVHPADEFMKGHCYYHPVISLKTA